MQLNIHQMQEYIRLQRAKPLNGNPDVTVGESTALTEPVKFNINKNTGTIELLDVPEYVTIVPTVSSITLIDTLVPPCSCKEDVKEVV